MALDRVKIEALEERIQAGEFENKLSFPEAPDRQSAKRKDIRDAYLEKNRAYRAESRRLEELFICEAIRACGLENHKNGRKAADRAWEEGHSSGYLEVLSELEDYAELMIG